jgi:hypothetical protein
MTHSPPLSPSQKTELQAIVGTILHYARAVDPTLLPIANELASQQATPTTKALTAANRALSYCAGHMGSSITYNACDMILFGHAIRRLLFISLPRSVWRWWHILSRRSAQTSQD